VVGSMRTVSHRPDLIVTPGFLGAQFWIVAEHGQKAGYVRNIAVSPRARLNAEKSKKNDYRLSATAVCPLSMSPA